MRQRRLRTSTIIRDGLAEISIQKSNLVYPLFITQKENYVKEIKSMPNISQFSPDKVLMEVELMVDNGINNFILFGIPEIKDFEGKEAANPKGPVPTALKKIRDQFGNKVVLYSDLCLCEYTTHGHCGVPTDQGLIQNDPSLQFLSDAGIAYAEAGSDWIAPSHMMDLRVGSLRNSLDESGFTNTAILSYSAKFASNYYGPFRDAAESPPSFGDRKTYQIDYRNSRQALREMENDEMEGADAVMVKPALPYLDIISRSRELVDTPIFAYNVSGEYSMVKFGAMNNLFSEKEIVIENLTSIRRAGADMVITYHARDIVTNNWFER